MLLHTLLMTFVQVPRQTDVRIEHHEILGALRIGKIPLVLLGTDRDRAPTVSELFSVVTIIKDTRIASPWTSVT